MDRAPPPGALFDYPVATSFVIGIITVGALLYLAAYVDPTRGPLTISLLVILATFGSLALAMRFTIPQDPVLDAIIGGLVGSFGAVVGFWIGGAGGHKD